MNDSPEGNDRAVDGLGGSSAGGGLPQPEALELDHVYDALAHPRRRYLCYSLLGEPTWSLSDLATTIAAYENDVSEDAVSECQRHRVLVSLYHAHVPKLVDDGVLAFDDATETVRPAENAPEVFSVLEAVGRILDNRQATHGRGETDAEGR